MERTLPSDWKCCATCCNWAGCSRADAFKMWVTFIDEPARCCGGGFNGLDMQASSSCSNWEQRFKPRK